MVRQVRKAKSARPTTRVPTPAVSAVPSDKFCEAIIHPSSPNAPKTSGSLKGVKFRDILGDPIPLKAGHSNKMVRTTAEGFITLPFSIVIQARVDTYNMVPAAVKDEIKRQFDTIANKDDLGIDFTKVFDGNIEITKTGTIESTDTHEVRFYYKKIIVFGYELTDVKSMFAEAIKGCENDAKSRVLREACANDPEFHAYIKLTYEDSLAKFIEQEIRNYGDDRRYELTMFNKLVAAFALGVEVGALPPDSICLYDKQEDKESPVGNIRRIFAET